MLTGEKTHSSHTAQAPHASRAQDAEPGGHDSRPAVEQLAHESGCSMQLVQSLYEQELVFVGREARIRSYVPVLAMKRVRDALRGSRSAAHARSKSPVIGGS
jgi:hypothetical protein